MNSRRNRPRAWRHALSVLGFGLLSWAFVTADSADAQADDAKAKAAAAKAAKAKERGKNLEIPQRTKDDKQAARALRPTPGTGKKLDANALAQLIDAEVARQLKEESLTASARSSDAEFYRRLHLDLVGAIPTADKVQAFLESKEPNKRAKAIDELLADSRFGQYLGEQWSGMMLPRESNNRKLAHTPMVNWLAAEFNKNTPINVLVYDLLSASGNQDENGAVTYYVANPTVDKITDNVSRMFLGVQLQCAQCHNHPFTDWKQKEYWGMAQFFTKVRLTANPNAAAKKGVAPGIFETDKAPNKKNALPESAMKVNAKFLGGAEPKLASTEPFRPVLAKWVTSPENPYFAKAMANRFWHHLFGRGLVNPVDDMHENNLASHPELLNALAEQLRSSGFDVKFLVRAVCLSETYQRTSQPTAGNGDDRVYYSHRVVRAMLPEQLYDSLVSVVGKDSVGKRDLAPAAQKKGGANTPRDQFVNFFRVVDEPDVLEYQSGIPQTLRMMNAPTTNRFEGAVDRAIKSAGSNEPAKVIEQIYLTGLSRRPTAEETRKMTEFVQKAVTARNAYGDLYWAIVNSSEFVLNH